MHICKDCGSDNILDSEDMGPVMGLYLLRSRRRPRYRNGGEMPPLLERFESIDGAISAGAVCASMDGCPYVVETPRGIVAFIDADGSVQSAY